MRTLDKIITKVNCKHGAPMGRPNVGTQPLTVTSGPNCRIVKKNQVKVFDQFKMKIIAYNENFEIMIDLFTNDYFNGNESIENFSKSLTENGYRFTRRRSKDKHKFLIIVNAQTVDVINRLLSDM